MFTIETVNRHANWGDDLEHKTITASLSAFAFGFNIYKDLDDLNKWFNALPENDAPVEFPKFFCAPQDEDKADPFTLFFSIIKVVKPVSIGLRDGVRFSFTIVYVDSAFGLVPVVVGEDAFDLTDLQIGKLVAVNADIKADLSADPTPNAIAKPKSKKTFEKLNWSG